MTRMKLTHILLICFFSLQATLAKAQDNTAPTISAAHWNDIQIRDSSGAVLLRLKEVELKTSSMAGVLNGRIISTDGNRSEISYSFPDTPSVPILKSHLTKKGNQIDVHFDLYDPTPSIKSPQASLHLHIAEGAVPKGITNVGIWQRDANGGVPYEIPDGRLLRWQSSNNIISLAFEPDIKAEEKWQERRSLPLNFIKRGPGHYTAEFSILVDPIEVPPNVTAARWHGRPLALQLTTDHVYNWWSSSRELLEVKAILGNTTVHPRKINYNYWVRNYQGRLVAQERQSLDLAANQIFTVPIRVKADTRDILFVEVAIEDQETGQRVFSRTNLAVLPPHEFNSTPQNSLFGLAAFWPIPTQADVKRLLQRMGVRWLRNADIRQYKDINIAGNCHKASMSLDAGPQDREKIIKNFLRSCAEQENSYWEVMNEINVFKKGMSKSERQEKQDETIQKYINWLRDIQRIKQETPKYGIKIISAGMAGMDASFLKQFHDAGGWELVDAVALHPGRGGYTADYGLQHPYPGWAPSLIGDHWNFYGAVRSAKELVANLGEKPLWLTEMYAPTTPNSSWADSQRNQADNVILQYALAASEGIRVAMFYQMFDSIWTDRQGINPKNREYFYGLINRDLSFKPGFLAYCTIAEALDEAKFIKPLAFPDKQTRGLLFSSPRGSFAVLWNRADGYRLTYKSSDYVSPEAWKNTWKTTTSTSIPAQEESIVVINSIGQRKEVRSHGGYAQIELTGAPVIIYGLKGDNIDDARQDNAR